MRVIIDKKNKIIFYLFVFFLVTTINFYNPNLRVNKSLFPVNIIEINGVNKIDRNKILLDFNDFYGKNIFKVKKRILEDKLTNNNLVNRFRVKKHYPNKIIIDIEEVDFIALIIKEKKKYLLTTKDTLVPLNANLKPKIIPVIYGLGAEKYFQTFNNSLKKNNFDMSLIKNYYFFQIRRWDLILNNDLIIKFPSKDVDEAINIANKLLKNINFKNIKILDLRIKNKIITQS